MVNIYSLLLLMEIVELYENEIPNLDVSWIVNELGFKNKEELLDMTHAI